MKTIMLEVKEKACTKENTTAHNKKNEKKKTNNDFSLAASIH